MCWTKSSRWSKNSTGVERRRRVEFWHYDSSHLFKLYGLFDVLFAGNTRRTCDWLSEKLRGIAFLGNDIMTFDYWRGMKLEWWVHSTIALESFVRSIGHHMSTSQANSQAYHVIIPFPHRHTISEVFVFSTVRRPISLRCNPTAYPAWSAGLRTGSAPRAVAVDCRPSTNAIAACWSAVKFHCVPGDAARVEAVRSHYRTSSYFLSPSLSPPPLPRVTSSGSPPTVHWDASMH